MDPLTYKEAGVSTQRAQHVIGSISQMAQKLRKIKRRDAPGGFAAILDFPNGYKNPQIVLSTDGVGTKLLLCNKVQKFDSIGIDLVAMCANDVLAVGAEPYAFLDYYATSKLDPLTSRLIFKGIVKGCKLAHMALVGGETAEMPGVYQPNDFDLAGFCVGLIEKDHVLEAKALRAGDMLIGLPSAGIHSNGFSLVRRILESRHIAYTDLYNGSARTWGQVLLKPTKIYVEEVLPWVQKQKIKAMSHITGGGMDENLSRVLPYGLKAMINMRSWRVPKIFKDLQKLGNVSTPEMFHAFNMGIGFVLICDQKNAQVILKKIAKSKVIGTLEKRSSNERQVECV